VSIKRTFANLSSVIGGEALVRLASFFSLIVIARLYGPATLGYYAAVLATATIATQLADNGLQAATAVTEIGRNPDSIDRTVYRLYAAKVMLIIPALLGLITFSHYCLPGRTLTVIGGLVIAKAVLQQFAQLNLAILKAIDRMRSIGWIQAAHFLFLVSGISVVYVKSLPVYVLFVWLLGGQILEFVLSGRKLWLSGIRPMPSRIRECLRLAKRSTPVGITYAVANLIPRIDILVLSVISSGIVVGRFAAAHMLLTFLYAVAWMSGSVWLPELVRIGTGYRQNRRFVNKWITVIFAGSAPCALALLLLAPHVVPALYGPAFTETGKLLGILSLSFPFVIANGLLLNRAIALSETSVFVGIYCGSAASALILDLVLLQFFGISGLASGIVLREILMFSAFQVLRYRQPQFSTLATTASAASD